jgi:hypothetical protein
MQPSVLGAPVCNRLRKSPPQDPAPHLQYAPCHDIPYRGPGERPCHTKPARSLPQTRRSQTSQPSPLSQGHHTIAANAMTTGSPPVFCLHFCAFLRFFAANQTLPAFIQWVGPKFQACFRNSDQVLIKILRSASAASSGARTRSRPPPHGHGLRHHPNELRLKPPRHARCHRRCCSIRRRRSFGTAEHA